MTIDEMIAVMEHYKNGGEIQVALKRNSIAHKINPMEYDWQNICEPSWDWDLYSYRIKPEPKVIPWTLENAPCIIKVKNKNKNEILVLYLKATYNAKKIYYTASEALAARTNYDREDRDVEYLAENYTQLDGSPCGTLEKNCHYCANCINLKCTKPTCKNYEHFKYLK